MENEKEPAIPQMDPNRLKLAEHERTHFFVSIEPGITRRQVIDPAFFAHVGRTLRPYSEITLVCDDGTLYARLLVLQAERTWARVHVLEWHDLTTRDVAMSKSDPVAKAGPPPDASEAFRVEYKGTHKKWCVIRAADNAYVHEGDESKVDARNWLDGHLKVTT